MNEFCNVCFMMSEAPRELYKFALLPSFVKKFGRWSSGREVLRKMISHLMRKTLGPDGTLPSACARCKVQSFRFQAALEA